MKKAFNLATYGRYEENEMNNGIRTTYDIFEVFVQIDLYRKWFHLWKICIEQTSICYLTDFGLDW